MESEKFNPDATCGFRISESYFEDAIVDRLYNIAWKLFTERAPEFVELKFKVISALYESNGRLSKSPIIKYINRNNSTTEFPEITDANLFQFHRDAKILARKIDAEAMPIKLIQQLICANPSLIADPLLSFLYLLAIEKYKLGDRRLLNAFMPSAEEFKEKTMPESMYLFLFWGVEGLLESLDRITNSPEKNELISGVVKGNLVEELFFKLLISHPPLKKIALQQSWVILQNEGFDIDSNSITKKINANPLRKEILSKDAFKKLHTTFKQTNSLENFKEFLDHSTSRLKKWSYKESYA